MSPNQRLGKKIATVPDSPAATWECCGLKQDVYAVRHECKKRERCVVSMRESSK